MIETRIRWEPEEHPPEGWRGCIGFFSEDGEHYDCLWSSAPTNTSPYLFPHKWIRSKMVIQTRTVTEWGDEA